MRLPPMLGIVSNSNSKRPAHKDDAIELQMFDEFLMSSARRSQESLLWLVRVALRPGSRARYENARKILDLRVQIQAGMLQPGSKRWRPLPASR